MVFSDSSDINFEALSLNLNTYLGSRIFISIDSIIITPSMTISSLSLYTLAEYPFESGDDNASSKVYPNTALLPLVYGTSVGMLKGMFIFD